MLNVLFMGKSKAMAVIGTPDVLESVWGKRVVRFPTQATRVVSAHEKCPSNFVPFSHGFVALGGISVGKRAFSVRSFSKKAFSSDICNVLWAQPLGMRLLVAAEVRELFDN